MSRKQITLHAYTDTRGRNLCDECDRWQGAAEHGAMTDPAAEPATLDEAALIADNVKHLRAVFPKAVAAIEAEAAQPTPAAADLRAALERLITTVEMMFSGAERDPAMIQARAALAAQPAAPSVAPDAERLALYLHQARASNDDPLFDMDEALRIAHIVLDRIEQAGEPPVLAGLDVLIEEARIIEQMRHDPKVSVRKFAARACAFDFARLAVQEPQP